MTQAHKTPGARVELHPKVFEPPYAPHFNYLKGHTFIVLNPNVYPGHVKLRDEQNNRELILHDDELKTVDK